MKTGQKKTIANNLLHGNRSLDWRYFTEAYLHISENNSPLLKSPSFMQSSASQFRISKKSQKDFLLYNSSRRQRRKNTSPRNSEFEHLPIQHNKMQKMKKSKKASRRIQISCCSKPRTGLQLNQIISIKPQKNSAIVNQRFFVQNISFNSSIEKKVLPTVQHTPSIPKIKLSVAEKNQIRNLRVQLQNCKTMVKNLQMIDEIQSYQTKEIATRFNSIVDQSENAIKKSKYSNKLPQKQLSNLNI